jgi:outer membrane protein TolC
MAAVALVICCASGAFAEKRQLTIDDAVKLAMQRNPRLLSTAVRSSSARDATLSVGARMLPSVVLSEEYQHFDSPFNLNFGGMPILVRKQDTNTFVASANQPLLGILHLSQEYLAERKSAEATAAGSAVTRAQVTQLVRSSFLQYFQAKALEVIARASEAELQSQVTVAQARLRAGTLTNADVLRVQVAAANAQQQELFATSQATSARATLLAALGLDAGDPDIELVEPTNLMPENPSIPNYRDAAAQALRQRPELAQLKLTLDSAQHQKSARYLTLLPEVDLEGAYLRVDGQKFAPTNSAYVGIKASWPIWQWGATFFAARAADKQAHAAALDLQSERDTVSAEVESNLAQLRAALGAVRVAEQTIASAEEAYRVENVLVKAGSATTTDLLDAQAALTTARLNVARARYDYALLKVALSRVLGE